MVTKLTPILVVKEIEPALPLWVDGLGFAVSVSVPEEDRLGFVILTRGDVEVMYQTNASIDREVSSGQLDPHVPRASGRSALYLEVADLEDLRRRLQGFRILVSQRDTPYGKREMFVEEPGGHLLIFAAPAA